MNALPTNLMLAPTPALPTPAGGATPRDGTEPGFAQCLDQATGREPPAHAGSEPAAAEAPADAASQDTEARDAAPQNAAAQGARRPATARKADATVKAAVPPEVAEATAKTPPTAAAGEPVDAATTTKTDDAPALGELLPGWPPAAATPATAAVPATAAPAIPATAATPAAAVARAGDATPVTTLPGAQAAGPIAAAVDAKPSKAEESEAPTFALPAPAVAPAHTAPAAAAAETLPVHAHVAAPVDSPAFAPALATQVRWLVRDGLQQAQLSLNPAEMGPVTVQIVLDGREARIDFRADLALTRNAIESSLPVLAAALDESGLRLTGGGVHDGQTSRHPQGTMAQGGSGPGASGRGAVALDDETSARTTRAGAGPARGLVDLVA